MKNKKLPTEKEWAGFRASIVKAACQTARKDFAAHLPCDPRRHGAILKSAWAHWYMEEAVQLGANPQRKHYGYDGESWPADGGEETYNQVLALWQEIKSQEEND